jgi:protein-tyrosine phosphatase
MNDRTLSLEGIHNFRDYGGYVAAGRGRLRSGCLYRSGQHVGATAADLHTVASLDLKTVIDLRGNSERIGYPCARPSDFNAVVLFADGETAGSGGAPHTEAARGVVTAGDARAAMVALYASMPFRPNLITIFRLYFEALADRDGRSLLHCFAGKDRTGLAAALLHRLMGVGADDLMADYLMTNSVGNSERRIAAGAEMIRQSRGHQITDAAIRTLMMVEADYLDAAFASICERHRSIEAYAHDVLGVTPALRSRIEARLIV